MGLSYEEKKRMKEIQEAIKKRMNTIKFCERKGLLNGVAKKKKEEVEELRKELEKYRNKSIEGLQLR